MPDDDWKLAKRRRQTSCSKRRDVHVWNEERPHTCVPETSVANNNTQQSSDRLAQLLRQLGATVDVMTPQIDTGTRWSGSSLRYDIRPPSNWSTQLLRLRGMLRTREKEKTR